MPGSPKFTSPAEKGSSLCVNHGGDERIWFCFRGRVAVLCIRGGRGKLIVFSGGRVERVVCKQPTGRPAHSIAQHGRRGDACTHAPAVDVHALPVALHVQLRDTGVGKRW